MLSGFGLRRGAAKTFRVDRRGGRRPKHLTAIYPGPYRRLSCSSSSGRGAGAGSRHGREETESFAGSGVSWLTFGPHAPAATARREDFWPGSPRRSSAPSGRTFGSRGRFSGVRGSNLGGRGPSFRGSTSVVPMNGSACHRTPRWTFLTTAAAALASAYCVTATAGAAAAPSDAAVGGGVVAFSSSASQVVAAASVAAGALSKTEPQLTRAGSKGTAEGDAAGGSPPPASPPFTSVQASKGHRSYMEDEYFLSTDGTFAAVYDGHGGSSVSRYLRQNLYAQVQAHFPPDGELTLEKVAEALRVAFKRVDDEVMNVRHWSFQGSTAVVVLLHRDVDGRRYLVTANVGDSRAVLSRRGRAIELTHDHKPNCETELERVHQLGGKVEWFGFFDPERQPIEGTGVWRINGNLAVARAIGDRSERPFVSGEVDLRTYMVEPDGDQFVILATDGLWDVMSSDEAVEYVQEVMGGAVGALREGADGRMGAPSASERPTDMKLSDWTQRYADDRRLVRAAMLMRKKKMARYLTEEAIRRGTMDNVTVVVVWLS